MKNSAHKRDVLFEARRDEIERDYAKWIAAVPKRHRDFVRSWVNACGQRGRVEFWEAVEFPDDLKYVAGVLLANARMAKAAKPFVCEMCESPTAPVVAVNDERHLFCAECMCPGDGLRARIAKRSVYELVDEATGAVLETSDDLRKLVDHMNEHPFSTRAVREVGGHVILGADASCLTDEAIEALKKICGETGWTVDECISEAVLCLQGFRAASASMPAEWSEADSGPGAN